MSDVNAVLSGQGNYGFEDTVARKRAEKAVELVNENRTVIDETVEQITEEFKILESAFITKKLSGSILRIDDSANGLFSSFKMVIPPDQNGEGDPSPENIRSFVQHNLNPNGLGIYVYICNGNMFKFTYDSATSSGITKTVNSDGSVSFEGTSASSSTIVHNLGLFYLPAGTYQFYGMPELEDGVSFRYRMNANSIGGSLIRYFETDGTIFEVTQRTRVGIRAYLTAPQGTEVDFDIYPIIKLVDDPNKEFTTNPSVYTSWFTTPASTKFVTGMFEISNDPTVGYYREFKRYTNYNGELLPGKWVSDRDVYVPGRLPTIGADVFDLETTESAACRLTSDTDYGASIIYNDTYLYGLTDNHVITAEYITNRSVNYESLNEIRYRPHLFDTIAMKCLKTIPLYEDSYTYYANGFAVTDKYLVLALIPVKTSPIAEKVNVFMAFDKNTLELADIENNPKVVNVVNDLGLVGSHANNMTYVPPSNEIYVRTAKSRKSIVLNADTLDVKRVEIMPHNGGCAYDSVTNQWAFLATTNGVTALTITNGSRDTILKKVSINSQGYTQGIAFYNGIIFVPTSTDNLNKGNSIVAVNTDGVVLADWWFDGGDEFEDVDIMDDSRLLLLTTSYASGYRIYSAAYKPFNKKSADIKSYDIYRTSTIDSTDGDYEPNLLDEFCTFSSGSSQGITYDLIDAEAHTYHVYGATTSSVSILNFYNGPLPDCLKNGETYSILYENSSENRDCHVRFLFYDKNNTNVSISTSYGYSYDVIIPETAVTMIVRFYIVKNKTVDTTIKYLKLVKTQKQKMLVPYIISFVDDDTTSTTFVERYYNSCKRNGINGTYSVITNHLDEDDTDTDLLLDYEDDGMAMIIHCSEQTASLAPEWTNRDYDGCRKNLYKGIRSMAEKGFVNFNYWTVPGGHINDEFKKLAIDAGMKCLISSANYNYNHMSDSDRYFIKRYALNPTDDNPDSVASLGKIKETIDNMSNFPSCWLIITTHFNDWDSVTWDSTIDSTGYPVGYSRMNELIQYAKASGAEIMTIPEAWRYFEPIIEANEQRYNKVKP